MDLASLLLPKIEPDGLLVELRAAMRGEEDWRRVVDLLRTSAAMVDFSVDDRPGPVPSEILSLFAKGREANVLLSCRVSGLLLNVHFNDPAALEVEIDPREVDARRVEDFGRFWRRLGDVLQRPVSLHQEPADGPALLTYDPRAGMNQSGTFIP